MPRYKAVIAYDGTDFAGFQRQNNLRTVQSEIEKTLQRLNGGNFVPIHGSGRTDAGVHAEGQVIHFDLTSTRDPEKLRFALDTQTPEDISVYRIEIVSDDFHARYTKHHKCYEYRIDLNKAYRPRYRRYMTHYTYPLDIDKMRQAAKDLEGTHDFTSFCATGSQVIDKVRTIDKIEIKHNEEDNFLIMTFHGNGFLYKMIRIMVGTLLRIGNGRLPVNAIPDILAQKNRDFIAPTAEAKGLCLMSVDYDD